MSTFLENQNWRYATKKFDATKKVSVENLELLKEAIQLSTSSYGLQAYKVIIVANPALRSKLQPQSWGQSQIVDASHLFVFANIVDMGQEVIDDYFNNVIATREITLESVQGYKSFMSSKIMAMPKEEKNIWNEKQTYLALANLMNAAAELKIDVCPMEGFDPAQYNEILGLNKLNLNATLVATVGYRSSDDVTQHYKKVRKSEENLFITI
jgi:nitroreductase